MVTFLFEEKKVCFNKYCGNIDQTNIQIDFNILKNATKDLLYNSYNLFSFYNI